MTSNPFRVPDRRSAVVGVVLFAIAAVTYWDASRMVVRAGYGMGANTTSYFVAVLFALLAIGHFVSAFKPSNYETEAADWKAFSEFTKSPVFRKVREATPDMLKMTADMANEPNPEFDAELEQVIGKTVQDYFAKADEAPAES